MTSGSLALDKNVVTSEGRMVSQELQSAYGQLFIAPKNVVIEGITAEMPNKLGNNAWKEAFKHPIGEYFVMHGLEEYVATSLYFISSGAEVRTLSRELQKSTKGFYIEIDYNDRNSLRVFPITIKDGTRERAKESYKVPIAGPLDTIFNKLTKDAYEWRIKETPISAELMRAR